MISLEDINLVTANSVARNKSEGGNQNAGNEKKNYYLASL